MNPTMVKDRSVSIAHLGPAGTHAEAAALAFAHWLQQQTHQLSNLHPYVSIAQTLRAVAQQQVDLAVVPVENSLEGSVTMTLDSLWQLQTLQIQFALVLPITHALLSGADRLTAIQTVYSHPQALAQCQGWLDTHLPTAQLVPTNSTTEPLQWLKADATLAAISSQRAAQLYDLPILACPINDNPDNCTRFWVMGNHPTPLEPEAVIGQRYTSLAFSLPANQPGALVKALQIFAQLGINLSRIESRPTKRSLGEYVVFY
ncbi:prephenate dehydratase [Neosynechococcus sphagnicola]|uniref:prephenate dehydratase n=1 Tax=Neosynechococcus sphagnicola TaxID=1501145 RepID=UPI000B0FA333